MKGKIEIEIEKEGLSPKEIMDRSIEVLGRYWQKNADVMNIGYRPSDIQVKVKPN